MRLRFRHAAADLCRRAPQWVLPALVVVCALPVAAWADHTVETRLIKPVRGEVRIHWQAQVSEAGGAFIVYRGRGGNYKEVARLVADANGDYEVVDRGWRDGRSTYQLRYRASDHSEFVLVTSAVHLEVIDSSTAAGWLAGHAQPVTLPSALRIPIPNVAGPRIDAGPAPAGENGRQPPTPPPRRA